MSIKKVHFVQFVQKKSGFTVQKKSGSEKGPVITLVGLSSSKQRVSNPTFVSPMETFYPLLMCLIHIYFIKWVINKVGTTTKLI